VKPTINLHLMLKVRKNRYTYTSPFILSNPIKIHYIISETKRADRHVDGYDFPIMRSICDVGANKFSDMNFYCREGITIPCRGVGPSALHCHVGSPTLTTCSYHLYRTCHGGLTMGL
jgi:hypothetical protein